MSKQPTSRTALALMAAAAASPTLSSQAVANDAAESASSYSNLAQREMIRRERDVKEGEKLLLEGREAYAKGDYQQAVDQFSQALQLVPDAPLFQDRRQSITNHLSDASIALSIQHRKVGKFPEARTLLDNILTVDPDNALAKRELSYLDDPIRTNPGLDYQHTQNVDAVRRALYTAEGHYNLGKYDDAIKEYEKALRIDPYNSAARRGMERVEAAKSDYLRAAYDQTRATLLREVDAAWELTVPEDAPDLPIGQNRENEIGSGVARITEKLRTIIIPSLNFEDTTVEEAIDFLRLRSRELDTLELDPARKGVNFVIRRSRPTATSSVDAGLDAGAVDDGLPTLGADPSTLRIDELRVTNVPLEVALKYICDATRLRYKVDDFSVTLVPQTEEVDDVFTRTFTVPPDFASSLDSGGGAAPVDIDPFAPASSSSPASLTPRPPIIELLRTSGINFGEGTSATLSANGVLLVTNTLGELDKLEQLIDAIITKQPKQVKITTKFVEISQENTDELGFDWMLGYSNNILPGQDILAAAGGTIGNGTPRTGADFSGPSIVDFAPGTELPAPNLSTSGLRSGDGAISRNSIDTILNNPNRIAQNANVAPGIFSLTGVFTDYEVKMMMRGLAQKKGADLMTAPSVTARSGQSAKIEIIREFIYPTEYEPPEIPSSVGTGFAQGGGGAADGGGTISSFPVTPATPTAFETRNTGVTLEIEPTIGDNDFMIDLRFVPEIVEFEGFINYGSPIQSAGADADGNPIQVTITENRIEMPVFSTRRVSTALTIYDGYTVAVGGLMREDVQNVEDKVPILGDIPFVGRLFQSKAENRIKSNLIVFVTAQIIDATGRPLRGGTDEAATLASPDNADLTDLSLLPPL